MTVKLSGQEVAAKLSAAFSAVEVSDDNLAVRIKGEDLLKVAAYLKNRPDLAFNHLIDITAVDCYAYFEVVYRFTSLAYNQSLVLKVRCDDRTNPTLPRYSVCGAALISWSARSSI